MCNEKEKVYLEIKRLNEEHNIGLTEEEIMAVVNEIDDLENENNL